MPGLLVTRLVRSGLFFSVIVFELGYQGATTADIANHPVCFFGEIARWIFFQQALENSHGCRVALKVLGQNKAFHEQRLKVVGVLGVK